MVAQTLDAPPTNSPVWLRAPAVQTPRHLPETWVPGVTDAAQDELFRTIALQAGCAQSGVLAIASACAGEGKSTLAIALASVTARDFPDRKVVYVEADFARPQAASRLGLPANPGLLDCLVRDRALSPDAFRATSLPNLSVLPAGGPDLTPTRWLCSPGVAAAISQLRHSHDLVVLDLPAITTQSGALVLAELADRVLFVVREGATPAPLVRQTMAQLPPKKLAGVVLNGARSHVPGWVRRLLGLS